MSFLSNAFVSTTTTTTTRRYHSCDAAADSLPIQESIRGEFILISQFLELSSFD
ncbi:hypothetical protein M6B38_153980 [Iris pallida]|uniref:Uncharacterized protein n=1 Tax=Iris pallida TaxID=29817 RepID=A0AAX6F579_IRIPA|nr:hypothetical protein M6B38_153980 [Iris pallida]